MVLTMWFLWASISSVLFGLMVYGGMLRMHEGAVLVLSEVTANSYTQAVHEIVIKIQARMQPALRAFGGATAVLSLLLVSTYVYNAAEIIRSRMH